MEQIPYWWPENIRRRLIEFSRPADLVTGISALVLYRIINQKTTVYISTEMNLYNQVRTHARTHKQWVDITEQIVS